MKEKNENQNIIFKNEKDDKENEIKVKFETNHLIDIIEKNQRKFYNGIINKNLKVKIKEINK